MQTVETHTVFGKNVHQLLDILIESIRTGEPAKFETKFSDDFSDNPPLQQFTVRVLKLHLDTKPFTAEIEDQNENWIMIRLPDEASPIEFDIRTTT